MKIITVVGARPQFIKAAVLSRLCLEDPEVEELIIHTGQHYDPAMSAAFFDELGIPEPWAHLGVGSATHGAQTGRMLEAIETILMEQRPDCLLVYGDTNSTLAGALAAAKLHVPVAHVEAGLRSFNRRMPEEINRILTDHVSTWLFAPTQAARRLLREEGVPEAQVHLVGDVMFDASRIFAESAMARSGILGRLGLSEGGYILATIHRAENTDDPARLRMLFEGLAEVSGTLPVVLPLHPRTRGLLERHAIVPPSGARLHLIDPVGYLDMVQLEARARCIATDSGGVQKEAFFHQVPCVTLREETEWVELVEQGWNRLVPPCERASLVAGILAGVAAGPGIPCQPYGDGHAGEKILSILKLGPGLGGRIAARP